MTEKLRFQQSFEAAFFQPAPSRYLDRNEQPFYLRVSPPSPPGRFQCPQKWNLFFLSTLRTTPSRFMDMISNEGSRKKRGSRRKEQKKFRHRGRGGEDEEPASFKEYRALPPFLFPGVSTRDTFHVGHCLGQWSLRHRYLSRKMRRSFHLIAI